ncbi:vacuolar-type H+-ATPase subunit H [Devosia subaequoris]|uniref:Vacuolar-type H+-ATPase subunit H n=1 Tax=Devosia subaequoris TaxID=395930 RepID=A0A7W6INB7_9HYPH|nr:DUF3618 domain-containing protein [Devosia subaequoris]MBB4052748.1 vacuolar-type H+-ATPase subunit H [Devosia subaequoris]MCP1209901.1 DUF3618 domain-containing protein [Devosia subaequoris]
MAHEDTKSSAQLQREVDQQRARLEDRIDGIQQKLSPGQLIDELMAYTKDGGGEFISSLQRNVTANPLPVALLGVSLAWLMAKPASAPVDTDAQWDDSINARRGYGGEVDDYPVATISGSSMKRVSHKRDESGMHFSEFADEAGKKYRAASDEAGRRAGHFMDETGKRFRGFTDGTGKQVEHFRDEAGNLMDEASGWASHGWQQARDKMGDAQNAVRQGIAGGKAKATQATHAMGEQMNTLNQTIVSQFRDQPLVAGALAFAVGAAFGSALPHTEQEDKLMGDAADAAKSRAGREAERLYDEGRERAEAIYDEASERAGKLYQDAREGVAGASETKDGAKRSQ